ncbi:FeoB-associated Cys-rich membrane protein [Sphingobacterium oryzagri]|uniref:FeoB-associated Cys-rich membrane protein n=1 Tax=Sphingobacterium oryzagri TaxID=3025669 RepID=A0ABY7WCP3_9SPHI|nr:FeoB-associated Cys-rich membrane protein [Sphingobacterium sp. KACC 22765]WDF67235.1 FeoB-associated Cys-rich membrane protein [Sphingobacterium sp. KACC 22765]
MDAIIQYIIIGVVFIAAVAYIVKRFLPSKRKGDACGKGCGCAMTTASPGPDTNRKR